MRVKQTPSGEWVWTNPEVERARLAWKAEMRRSALVRSVGLGGLALGWGAVLLGMPASAVAIEAGFVLGAMGNAWWRMHRAWKAYDVLAAAEMRARQSFESKSPE